MASSLQEPHISGNGRKELHTFGRSGEPNILQRNSWSNWIHGTPAGLPFGIPGIADDIDGAMQHAPQPGRHFMFNHSCMLLIYPRRKKRQLSKTASMRKTSLRLRTSPLNNLCDSVSPRLCVKTFSVPLCICVEKQSLKQLFNLSMNLKLIFEYFAILLICLTAKTNP